MGFWQCSRSGAAQYRPLATAQSGGGCPAGASRHVLRQSARPGSTGSTGSTVLSSHGLRQSSDDGPHSHMTDAPRIHDRRPPETWRTSAREESVVFFRSDFLSLSSPSFSDSPSVISTPLPPASGHRVAPSLSCPVLIDGISARIDEPSASPCHRPARTFCRSAMG